MRACRLAAGYRQSDIVLLSGISRTLISNYERGVGQLRTDQILKIAEILNCDPGDLLARGEGTQRVRLAKDKGAQMRIV